MPRSPVHAGYKFKQPVFIKDSFMFRSLAFLLLVLLRFVLLPLMNL